MTRRIQVRVRVAVPAIAATLWLAACQGAGAGSPSGAASADGGAALAVAEAADVGQHLVDIEGRTLYVFLDDSPGQSACAGSCAESWPPATTADGEALTGGDGVTGAIGTIERDDGTLQLTIEGWPLYRYAGDQAAGDVTGEGVGGVWFVARPDGSPPGAAGGSSAEPSADATEDSDNPYDY